MIMSLEKQMNMCKNKLRHVNNTPKAPVQMQALESRQFEEHMGIYRPWDLREHI